MIVTTAARVALVGILVCPIVAELEAWQSKIHEHIVDGQCTARQKALIDNAWNAA